MKTEYLVWAVVILLFLCVLFAATLLLYRRQIQSICRQLRVHREEESNTDIWLDVLKGPFGELQKELNGYIRRQREERVEHRRQEKEFRELVTNVSHDIRTPITAIFGYFQLFIDTEDEAKREQYAAIIDKRLRQFQSMLEDFYVYSRAVSDDRSEDGQRCNISRIVSEGLFAYYREIEEGLGTPQLEFPEHEIYAYAVPGELQRAIQNIIKNALVHGCGELRVALEEREQQVLIRVENRTLEEIPTETDKVFQRTYKADSARNSSGSGLGLSIVKELVEKMGGSVQAYAGPDNLFGILLTLKRLG